MTCESFGVDVNEEIIGWMMDHRDLLQQGLKPSVELSYGFILMFPKGIQPSQKHVGVLFDTPSLEKGFF